MTTSNTITKTDLENILNAVLPPITTTTLTPTFSNVVAGTVVTSACKQYGNVVYLAISVRNTSAVAVGSMIFEQTVSGIPLPPTFATTGTYYGARPLIATFDSLGVIRLRNTYSASITMGSSDYVTLSFTYVV